MKALVLDFDGVISDSAPEAFVVALQTYADLCPGTSLQKKRVRLDRDEPWDPEGIQADPVYAKFLELMPLGNRAEDYGVMLEIIDRELKVPDQGAYDGVRSAQSAHFLEQFHARFYVNRSALAGANPDAWRRLFGSYRPFLNLLRRRAGEVELAIATAKDRRSVELLLKDYGIDGLFAPERVLDKDAGVSKREHLRRVHESLDIAYPEITFMDDKVNHLDAVAPLGVRCALAAWGYNGPREHRLARERGYLVCSLKDVEQQLFPAQVR